MEHPLNQMGSLKVSLKGVKLNIAGIFPSSIYNGEILDTLNLACITPVHNGGSRAQPVQ